MNNIEFNVYNKYEKSYSSAKAMAQAICPHNCANSGVCAFSSDNETIPCANEWPRLTCYYDVIDTSGATKLYNRNMSGFKHMIVDGIWGIVVFFVLNIFFKSISIKIFLFIILVFPVGILSIVGVDGENLLYFLTYILKYVFKQKLYLYEKK